MRAGPAFEFPPEQADTLKKAVRLEWLTLAYIASAVVLLYLTMGSSQAMRTTFFDDLISLAPSIAFLTAARMARRKPDKEHPYGFHGAVSIGYLTASLALVAMGAFLLFEAVSKFAAHERTTIGGMELFGHTLWAGWPMLAAVAYSGLPTILIGRAKLKLAPKINDKVLFAEADMMKADWQVALATAIAVLGVGLGFWWADPLAAGLVSLSILHDGWKNTGTAVSDLIDRRPRKTDQSAADPLPTRVQHWLEKLDWVEAAEVRLREEGHVYFGEAFVTPKDGTRLLPEKIAAAIRGAKALDWRLHDLTVTPLRDLKEPLEPDEAPQRA
ncbi:MAG TPA: cation diffusion facilitator family transporter [Caulobacteraceae bacterium]|jgi:cation diffusion facilitator family transporter